MQSHCDLKLWYINYTYFSPPRQSKSGAEVVTTDLRALGSLVGSVVVVCRKPKVWIRNFQPLTVGACSDHFVGHFNNRVIREVVFNSLGYMRNFCFRVEAKVDATETLSVVNQSSCSVFVQFFSRVTRIRAQICSFIAFQTLEACCEHVFWVASHLRRPLSVVGTGTLCYSELKIQILVIFRHVNFSVFKTFRGSGQHVSFKRDSGPVLSSPDFGVEFSLNRGQGTPLPRVAGILIGAILVNVPIYKVWN